MESAVKRVKKSIHGGVRMRSSLEFLATIRRGPLTKPCREPKKFTLRYHP